MVHGPPEIASGSLPQMTVPGVLDPVALLAVEDPVVPSEHRLRHRATAIDAHEAVGAEAPHFHQATVLHDPLGGPAAPPADEPRAETLRAVDALSEATAAAVIEQHRHEPSDWSFHTPPLRLGGPLQGRPRPSVF